MNIGRYLSEHGIEYEEHEHPPAYTAQEVAAEEHISGKIMAKTVLVHDDKGYALCVLPASHKLDMEKVAHARHTRKIGLADEVEMARIFIDAEVGAEAPFGNLYNMPTLVDQDLAHNEDIVFQAGSHRRAIRMKYSDYAALTSPEVVELATHL
jgi:Ala-tRNA(Pro) deacylase